MKAFALVASTAILAASATAASAASTPKKYPSIEPVQKLYAKDVRGKRAPHLVVKKWLNGPAPDTHGKVVLIDFFATWCPDCRKQIPELNAFKKKFGDDLVIIAISDEDEDAVTEFMKKTVMDYKVAIDADATMKKKIGVVGIPHAVIMSPDNIVRYQGSPMSKDNPLTEEKIAQIIEASKK
jgi:cytochrome c biogenesis protein CcmG/thiol:disulfide interchange protein DsbE